MSRAMDASYRLMELSRHRKAAEIARRPPKAEGFAELEGARQALVVTYKRSGEPVPTVVNCALSEDERLYFRSEPQTAKVKRIGNDPRVMVGPCSVRGKPRGGMASGRARILAPEESKHAYELIRGNWSLAMRPSELAMDRLGLEVVYVEVTPVPADACYQDRDSSAA